MRRVVVCSPFRGDVARHLEVARAACRRIALGGDAPFAPHLLLPQFLDDTVPEERERGIACGLAWLAAADELQVVGTPTEGMAREIAAAQRLGVLVRRLR